MTEKLDAQVAVDDHVAVGLLGVRDHHDGLLLTVLFQRRLKPIPTLAAASAQLAVTQLQLVKLQLHDGSSAARGTWKATALRLEISLRPPPSPFDHPASLRAL